MGRFAPSPTGRMHAGNIYSSLVAWLIAKNQGGEVLLRIEDLDKERSRQEYIDQVMRDYERFGLFWDKGPTYQSNRDDAYENAFSLLSSKCGTYPCYCSRADLKAASAPHLGEKHVYAGTCRNLTSQQQYEKSLLKAPSYRVCVPSQSISFCDLLQGEFSQELSTECGDFLIRRADGLFAYQLAVVVDDAASGVTSVVRGYDLITSTPQQIFLQRMLGFEMPDYAHVPLLVNKQGKRLSKRDKDASLDQMLEEYKTPEAILGHIAYVGKLLEREEPLTPSEILDVFNASDYVARIKEEVGLLSPIVWS